MDKKCEKTKNWIDLCSSLEKASNESIGDINTQIRTRIADGETKLIVVAGRFKKNKVQLNFCPFCGANIVTEFKELNNA